MLGYWIDKAEFYSGKQDFEDLISIGCLPTASWTLRRFSPVQADLAISSILSSDNVAYLSWGTRATTFDGRKHQFTCIDRKKRIKTSTYEDYRRYETALKKIRRTFFKLLSAITHKGPQLRCSIDYVTGILVNENFAKFKFKYYRGFYLITS